MNLWRGLLAGAAWGLAGLVGPPAVISASTLLYWWVCGTQPFDRHYDIRWWQMRAFPGVVVVPMLLFFAGVVTYAPKRHVAFDKNLAILAVTSLPLAALLGAMGMAHPRYKSVDHPPMYFSEVLMFLIPTIGASFVLISRRSDTSSEHDSSICTSSQPGALPEKGDITGEVKESAGFEK